MTFLRFCSLLEGRTLDTALSLVQSLTLDHHRARDTLLPQWDPPSQANRVDQLLTKRGIPLNIWDEVG